MPPLETCPTGRTDFLVLDWFFVLVWRAGAGLSAKAGSTAASTKVDCCVFPDLVVSRVGCQLARAAFSVVRTLRRLDDEDVFDRVCADATGPQVAMTNATREKLMVLCKVSTGFTMGCLDGVS